MIKIIIASGAAGALDEVVKVKSRKQRPGTSEIADSLFALWASDGDRKHFALVTDPS